VRYLLALAIFGGDDRNSSGRRLMSRVGHVPAEETRGHMSLRAGRFSPAHPKHQNQHDEVVETELASKRGKRNQVIVKKRIT
jgi:hypothetical protein